MDPNFQPYETPRETSDKVARTYFGVTDKASRRRVIRQSLVSIVWITLLIPTAFYLRFRHIGPLGSGTAIFFDVYCLLVAIGLCFQTRTEYHSPVPVARRLARSLRSILAYNK